MRLPREDAPYEARVEFAAYLCARLEAGKQAELATSVTEATAKVKQLGRGLDDLEEPLARAVALRDAADDDLDETAQTLRKKLAATSLDAEKKPPYTGIFHNGIGHYIAAPIDKQIARYEELMQRMREHLAPADAMLAETLPLLAQQLETWKQAQGKVNEQKTAVALARTRLEAAEEDWARVVGRVYGTLFAEEGKKAAERFFPKTSVKRSRGADLTEEVSPGVEA